MDPRGAQSPHRVGGQVRQGTHGGQEPPTISVAARDELDSWVADDPSLDEYLQRDPNTNLDAPGCITRNADASEETPHTTALT